jgi:hypothetical protein
MHDKKILGQYVEATVQEVKHFNIGFTILK